MTRVNRGALYSHTGGLNPSTTTDWHIFDTDNEALARTDLLATAPSVVNNLLLTGLQLDHTAAETFYARLTYGITAIPDVGEIRLSASTKGGRATITQALATYDSVGYDPGTGVIPAPDTGGAIGLDESGNVTGVEITIPQPVFSLEANVDFALLSRAFWRSLITATGTVNSNNFWGYQPHELMFLGVDFDGTIRLNPGGDTQLGRIRFDFAVSESEIYDPVTGTGGVTVTGLERNISKRGWDHLEIRYGRFYDAVAKLEIKRPVAAWSRQVMPAINYGSRFGIGT